MFSNQTPNYGLPQYEQNDTLNVLTDFNGAMEAIDSTMKTNELAAASAQSKADGADTKANNNATAIGDLQTAQGADRTDINTLTGAVNTINSLIGNGEPTTTDKTIIGAINELDADFAGVNTRLANKYAYVASNTITVTGDGVKTYGDLLYELYTAYVTASSAAPTEVFKTVYMNVFGIGFMEAIAQNKVIAGIPDTIMQFEKFIGTASNIVFNDIILAAVPTFTVGTADGSSYTQSDGLSNVYPADQALTLTYERYIAI